MNKHFRRSPRRSTPRVKTTWQQLVFNNTVLLSSGAVIGFDLTPQPMRSEDHHAGQAATLLRMIATFNLSSGSDVDTPQSASFGISLYSHEALTGPSLNDPNSDPEQDWYYWASRTVERDSNNIIKSVSWDADIRSKRRVRGGQALIMVGAARSTNTVNLTVNVAMRLLWTRS